MSDGRGDMNVHSAKKSVCDPTPRPRAPPPRNCAVGRGGGGNPFRRWIWFWIVVIIIAVILLLWWNCDHLPLYWPSGLGLGLGRGSNSKDGVTDDKIKELVHQTLASCGGGNDLASRTAGGQIVSTRDTSFSCNKGPRIAFFGIPILKELNSANSLIQPGITYGDCWQFEGVGKVVIKLSTPAKITGFRIEHTPKINSAKNDMRTAPKSFHVYGFSDYNDIQTQHFFGSYVFQESRKNFQYFQPQYKSEREFPFVEFRILSNHGAKKTCAYRIRVFGNTNFDENC